LQTHIFFNVKKTVKLGLGLRSFCTLWKSEANRNKFWNEMTYITAQSITATAL